MRTEVSSIIEKGKAEQLRNIVQSLRSGRQSRLKVSTFVEGKEEGNAEQTLPLNYITYYILTTLECFYLQ